MSDKKLQEYFEFDEGDLNANRNGRLSEKQMKSLVDYDKTARKSSQKLGIILLLIAAVAGGIVIAVMGWKGWDASNLGLVILPLIVGGIGVLIITRTSNSKPDFKIKAVRGRVDYHSTVDSTSSSLELHIGGRQFEAEGVLAHVMMQGDEYALYYLEESDTIISAELLSEAK